MPWVQTAGPGHGGGVVSTKDQFRQPPTSLQRSLCAVVKTLFFMSFSEIVQVSVEFVPNFFRWLPQVADSFNQEDLVFK